MPTQSPPVDCTPPDSPHPLELRSRTILSLAEDADRPEIYALRHKVYALELGQHSPNSTARLSDPLDDHNIYIKACIAGRLAGFISITPPGRGYSVDKYFARQDFPFSFDDNLYEVRLLTVAPGHRRLALASALMVCRPALDRGPRRRAHRGDRPP
jgi:ribosomal protein S18 acetylase RimI-like enzyme